MKNVSYKLNIHHPCHENWEAMTSNETGKFCSHCSKSVIDFTGMTDEAVIKMLEKNSKNICGRLTSQQVNRRIGYNQSTEPSRLKQFLAAIMLLGATDIKAESNSVAQMEVVAKIATNEVDTLKEEESKIEHPSDSIPTVLKGKAIDFETKEPMGFCLIRPVGLDIYTTADTLGNFELIIPDSLVWKKMPIEFLCIGYETKVIDVYKKDIFLTVEMTPMVLVDMVGVIECEKRKRWWQFWK